MSLPPLSLATVETFRGLSADALLLLEARLDPVPIARGECLVREGEPADALFVVVAGRFAVEIGSSPEPVTEIARGATVGEIAFFAGGPRTATVRAIRDSIVVQLTRSDFDEISSHEPAIWQAITATLAHRLAAETRRATALKADMHVAKAGPRPRTIAIVGAGSRPIPTQILQALWQTASTCPGVLVLTSETAAHAIAGTSEPQLSGTEALNALEIHHPLIIFLADGTLTPWTEKAVKQADEVLLVGSPLGEPVGTSVALNTVEAFVLSLHRSSSRRLALIHERKGIVQGTRHWLAAREPAMHHHVALGDDQSLARLWRFLRGEARGFVACGGGAYSAAHVGIYKALKERAVALDMFGGTSGGAAMAAAFAQDAPAEEIDAGVHAMFIDGKALQRYTLPRYGLVDHTHFDAHLERQYGNVRIEDLWLPYFAVSADLSRYEIEVHRTGILWQAIRASAAIPGLLPPLYTSDGRMLVDGSVIANVPVETMRSLKRGPNIVVSFRAPESQHFSVDYSELPARRELLWRSLLPFSRQALPQAPSAATVLVRSLMANRSHFERHLEADDWLIVPPTPADMGALDWRQHSALVESAYRHTLAELEVRGVARST